MIPVGIRAVWPRFPAVSWRLLPRENPAFCSVDNRVDRVEPWAPSIWSIDLREITASHDLRATFTLAKTRSLARVPIRSRAVRDDSRVAAVGARCDRERTPRRRPAILLFLESVGVYSACAAIEALQSFSRTVPRPGIGGGGCHG